MLYPLPAVSGSRIPSGRGSVPHEAPAARTTVARGRGPLPVRTARTCPRVQSRRVTSACSRISAPDLRASLASPAISRDPHVIDRAGSSAAGSGQDAPDFGYGFITG